MVQHLKYLESMDDHSTQENLKEFLQRDKENFMQQMADFDKEQKVYNALNQALENYTQAIRK